MKLSTRGRYAVRIMLDLADNAGKFTPMKEVAVRQGLSLKYVERILPPLVRAGFVEGVSGSGGGYRLARAPENYTVGEILRLTEGDLAPVACLDSGAPPCPRAAICKTLPMWKDFYSKINAYFDNIKLSDLASPPQ